jgi:hypothetical protein
LIQRERERALYQQSLCFCRFWVYKIHTFHKKEKNKLGAMKQDKSLQLTVRGLTQPLSTVRYMEEPLIWVHQFEAGFSNNLLQRTFLLEKEI